MSICTKIIQIDMVERLLLSHPGSKCFPGGANETKAADQMPCGVTLAMY